MIEDGESTDLVTNPGFETAGNWNEDPSAVLGAVTSYTRGTDGIAAPRTGSYSYAITNMADGQPISYLIPTFRQVGRAADNTALVTMTVGQPTFFTDRAQTLTTKPVSTALNWGDPRNCSKPPPASPRCSRLCRDHRPWGPSPMYLASIR